MTAEPIHVLWTSGWDSTFRLLEVALIHKRPVQPHYVIDERRESAQQELNRMAQILDAVRAHAPEAQVEEPFIAYRHCLPAFAEIPEAFERNRSKVAGRQYEWLSRYARHNGLSGLEVNIFSTSLPTSFLREHIESFESAGPNYRLRSDASEDAKLLFSSFHFPMLDSNKAKMGDIAKAHGFDNLMELSWFCYKPWFDGSTCGMCLPCNSALSRGFGRRLTPQAHRRNAKTKIYKRVQAVGRWPSRRRRAWFPQSVHFTWRGKAIPKTAEATKIEMDR